jgi:ABC-2 type transport system ATP-binding protein
LPREKLIDVQGIAKTFRSGVLLRPFVALEGLDLSVEEGEIFGFLGPNGAGKTTTIKILLGLIHASRGTGRVLSHPFGDVEARRQIGFLADSPNFYRYLSARELLRFTGSLHGLSGADLGRRIEETLTRVGLVESARSRALKTYSRGMLQRTGIAAAILHQPRLVILDEPMNGLDPLGRREFRDLILSLKKEGVTILLSSHVLADIESTADRVGILNGGRLILCGSLSEILTDGQERIEISFRLELGSALTEIGQRLTNFHAGSQGWVGELHDSKDAFSMSRRILEAGGEILEMHRNRISLEEFFVRQVAAQNDSFGRAQAPSASAFPEAMQPAAGKRAPSARESVRA